MNQLLNIQQLPHAFNQSRFDDAFKTVPFRNQGLSLIAKEGQP